MLSPWWIALPVAVGAVVLVVSRVILPRRERRRAERAAEHERLTGWTSELVGDGQATVPLYRTSAGLVVMTPEAVRLVAEGRLTSRHNSG